MKVVFKIKEDDARNPGVIADCTGDNAGDSVGPTADGFETYGVTGVALISFIMLAVPEPLIQVKLLVWIFMMRVVMVLASGVSYLGDQRGQPGALRVGGAHALRGAADRCSSGSPRSCRSCSPTSSRRCSSRSSAATRRSGGSCRRSSRAARWRARSFPSS